MSSALQRLRALPRASSSRIMLSSSRPVSDSAEEPETRRIAPSQQSVIGKLLRPLHKEHIVAKEGFNRWLLVPPAVATHICLGSVYGWSLLNGSLTTEIGLVTSAADDWSLGNVVPIFSAICVGHGLSAALLGKWQERVGPRVSGVAGALCFGGGFLVGGLGVHLHNLPLLYTGFGLLAGTGIGLAYVPPVATLIRWFPDKRGLATGLTLMGFGGGALVVSPFMMKLMKMFSVDPEFVGKAGDVTTTLVDGRRFVEIEGVAREVVSATHSQIAQTTVFQHLEEGFYLAGSGSTGVAATLGVLGAAYIGINLLASLSYKLPSAAFMKKMQILPKSADAEKKPNPMISTHNVHIDDVMKTPQFWQIWFAFASVASAGMGVVSVASNMMTDIFAPSLPEVVTVTFAGTFVMALSAANLGGRLVWASVSDVVGRKNMYAVFTMASVPLYLSLPYFVRCVTEAPGILPLAGFYGATLGLISFFGGVYSTTPAYEADMFGTKFVGATHGRMLTASAAGAFVGPQVITTLRDHSEHKAIEQLSQKVDPQLFEQTFSAPISELASLTAAKTVNIQSLLAILPEGTQDPSPFLYDSSIMSAAGLVGVAAVANALMRPVNPKFHMSS